MSKPTQPQPPGQSPDTRVSLISQVSRAALWNSTLSPVLGVLNIAFAVLIRRRFGLFSGVYDVLLGLTSTVVQYSGVGIGTALLKFLPEVSETSGVGPVRRLLRDAVLVRMLLLRLTFSAYYFHDIFPTSFYAKATREITLFKIGYMGQFLLITGVAPLWVLAFVRSSREGRGRLQALLRDRWPMLLGFALVFAYGSAHATVHMMFGYRLLLPYLGALVLVGLDLLGLSDSDHRKPSADRAVVLLASGVLMLQLVQGSTVYSRSLGGVGLTGEFHDMSLSGYARNYLPMMDAGCRDLIAHARAVPRFDTRRPRFVTFTEGYIPNCDRTLYVLGHLVSYRHGVNEQFPPVRVFQESADYIHVLIPRHGTLEEQLPLPVEQFDSVSSRTIEYDGQDETFAIYFNPQPRAAQLPPYVR